MPSNDWHGEWSHYRAVFPDGSVRRLLKIRGPVRPGSTYRLLSDTGEVLDGEEAPVNAPADWPFGFSSPTTSQANWPTRTSSPTGSMLPKSLLRTVSPITHTALPARSSASLNVRPFASTQLPDEK